MKKILKSLFNYETILSSFIGAIGYGIGYNLPLRFNMHPIICIISCLILGTIFDNIAEYLLSRKIFTIKRNRNIFAIIVYFSYLLAWILVDYFLDYDLDIDFLMNIWTILIFQIISLVICKVKKMFK